MPRPDTMMNFIDEKTPTEDLTFLANLVNSWRATHYHAGSIVFVMREVVLEVLEAEADRTKDFPDGEHEQRVDKWIKTLDVADWIDITTIGDSHRQYLHSITGAKRIGEPMGYRDYNK